MTTKTPNTPFKRHKTLSRPEIFDKFAHWIAFPPSLRKPAYQKDFAILYEVSPDTLSDYKKIPGFWILVEEKKQKIASEIVDRKLMDKIFSRQRESEEY